MAVVNYTEEVLEISGREEGRKVTWTGMENGDTGQPYTRPPWSDRSVQVAGTFGAGGNCRITGSNDGTNFVALTDPQGNSLDMSAGKLEQISEACAEVRPEITAGDGSTSLTVTMVALRKFK